MHNNEFNPKTLYFIYLGDKLPSYAVHSLALSNKFSGLNVGLIANKKILSKLKVKNIECINIENFYDPSLFSRAKSYLYYPHNFRNGFWLKSLERFFVLEQFMKKYQVNKVLHAEIDQLLFRVDELFTNLERITEKGIFYPFHDQKSAVASIFFCNQYETLEELNKFATQGNYYSNEMKLLAQFSEINENVFALPTPSVFLANEDLYNSFNFITPQKIQGVVDAAQIGQWVAGIDPRNVAIHKKPKTKFISDSSDPLVINNFELRNSKFYFDENDFLNIRFSSGQTTRIYNLHLHSKIHKWISKSSNPNEKILYLANSTKPIALKISREIQIKWFLSEVLKNIYNFPAIKSFLISQINKKLNRRPSSAPYISGDTFRALADFTWESSQKTLDLKKINAKSIIFCEANLIGEFNTEVVEKLEYPVNVILGNSDYNHENNVQLNKLIQSKKVNKVFAQNLSQPLTKVSILPIGIENAWRAKHGKISDFNKLRKDLSNKRLHRIIWNFNIDTNFEVRSNAAKHLSKVPLADFSTGLSPLNFKKDLLRYAFIASPPGNGLDTHRTWEAMYLGCVPILLRSFLSDSYEQLGLPVWVVDSYQELEFFNEEFLAEKYCEISENFNSEVLWVSHWQNLISK